MHGHVALVPKVSVLERVNCDDTEMKLLIFVWKKNSTQKDGEKHGHVFKLRLGQYRRYDSVCISLFLIKGPVNTANWFH